MNLYMKYRIASTGGQFGYIGSPKKANFLCVLSLYFCPLVLGHPVFRLIEAAVGDHLY